MQNNEKPHVRKYDDFNDSLLASFLNDSEDAAGRARVLTLLERMQELERLYSIEPQPEAEIEGLEQKVNRTLDKYRVRHVVWGATKSRMRVSQEFVGPELTDYWTGDAHAVEVILDIARGGLIDRVRRCGWCKRWFVASRSDRHYCSDSCKQKRQASSPKFKAARAEYMRERYALLVKNGRRDKKIATPKGKKEGSK